MKCLSTKKFFWENIRLPSLKYFCHVIPVHYNCYVSFRHTTHSSKVKDADNSPKCSTTVICLSVDPNSANAMYLFCWPIWISCIDDTVNRHVFKVAWRFLRLVLMLKVVNFYLVSILKCSVVCTVTALYGPLPSNETCALFSSQQWACRTKSIRSIRLAICFTPYICVCCRLNDTRYFSRHITYDLKPNK
jgi:hypothetical protein